MIDGNALLARFETPFEKLRGKITPNMGMDRVTWFRAGGPAEAVFQPADEADLAYFLSVVPNDVPLLVVGIGSNLLVRDGGIKGFVIRLSAKGFGAIEQVGDTRLHVGTAVPDKRLAAAALKANLSGFHFYHGIPGGIGGALRMNAGANGVETVDRVVEVHALDRSGNKVVLSRDEMGYSYRHSSASSALIFTSAVFEGVPGDAEAIQADMNAVQNHRETVQPVREKTGGSTFKNPEGHSAWKLVDDAGCRGLTVGGAQMSPLHCNFMINTGTATGHDLEHLGETVRSRVLKNSGVKLEWEIKRLGSFETGAIVEPFLGVMI